MNLEKYSEGKKVIVYSKDGKFTIGVILAETPSFLILHDYKQETDISIPINNIQRVLEYKSQAGEK